MIQRGLTTPAVVPPATRNWAGRSRSRRPVKVLVPEAAAGGGRSPVRAVDVIFSDFGAASLRTRQFCSVARNIIVRCLPNDANRI